MRLARPRFARLAAKDFYTFTRESHLGARRFTGRVLFPFPVVDGVAPRRAHVAGAPARRAGAHTLWEIREVFPAAHAS
jgi:hypothetical protein